MAVIIVLAQNNFANDDNDAKEKLQRIAQKRWIVRNFIKAHGNKDIDQTNGWRWLSTKYHSYMFNFIHTIGAPIYDVISHFGIWKRNTLGRSGFIVIHCTIIKCKVWELVHFKIMIDIENFRFIIAVYTSYLYKC